MQTGVPAADGGRDGVGDAVAEQGRVLQQHAHPRAAATCQGRFIVRICSGNRRGCTTVLNNDSTVFVKKNTTVQLVLYLLKINRRVTAKFLTFVRSRFMSSRYACVCVKRFHNWYT